MFKGLLYKLGFVLKDLVLINYIPSVDEFCAVSHSRQDNWITKNYPDFYVRCHDEGFLACSFPLENIDFEEYRKYAEEYNVSEIISSYFEDVSDDRLTEINDGSELTQIERKSLAISISENDPDGWIGHHGFEISLKKEKMFAYFLGLGGGQAGPEFYYQRVFKTKNDLLEYLSELEIVSFESF